MRDGPGRDDVRLVWCDDPTRRSLQPGFSAAGRPRGVPRRLPRDARQRGLAGRLNDWIAETALERGEEAAAPLPMSRFRPNLVVDGDVPFAEDDWTRVGSARSRFRRGKPVGRCVMTTIDPDTLNTAKEPIRTLARHRLVGGKTLFAVHLVPVSTGPIHVGDEVTVILMLSPAPPAAPGR